jgi:hypothetical protein
VACNYKSVFKVIMKIKDFIEILEEENSKSRIIFEYNDIELILDEWSIESCDNLVIIKLFEKNK